MEQNSYFFFSSMANSSSTLSSQTHLRRIQSWTHVVGSLCEIYEHVVLHPKARRPFRRARGIALEGGRKNLELKGANPGSKDMGCGISIGSDVREESRTLSSANSAGKSTSRGMRVKKHIQMQTLLKLWPSFFLKSCKSSADHVSFSTPAHPLIAALVFSNPPKTSPNFGPISCALIHTGSLSYPRSRSSDGRLFQPSFC